MHGTRIPHRAGFTLIELVAIVGIIFLLAGMLLPARAKTRRVDLSTICLRNAKEFAIAWNLYSANNHQVCNNFTIPDTLSSIATKRFDNWANNLMTWTITGTDGSSNTNIALAKSGVLSKYASDDIAMYKCPSDQFLSAVQRRAGWKARLRSISMNALFGRWDSTASSGSGRSFVDSAYRQFLKPSDIPDPANTWLTIEEHPDSINDGFFVGLNSTNQWGDLPASYHGGGCTFTFPDGHVEIHSWQSKTTKVRVFAGTAFPTVNPDATGRKDLQWLRSHTGYVSFK